MLHTSTSTPTVTPPPQAPTLTYKEDVDILTPSERDVDPDSLSFSPEGMLHQHGQVQSLSQDPHVAGADAEHEDGDEKLALPVLQQQYRHNKAEK